MSSWNRWIVLVCLLVAGFVLMHLSQTESCGQEEPLAIGDVSVVSYADGRTGFFTHDAGMLYIYDADLRRCVTIRRIKSLGSELERVRN